VKHTAKIPIHPHLTHKELQTPSITDALDHLANSFEQLTSDSEMTAQAIADSWVLLQWGDHHDR